MVRALPNTIARKVRIEPRASVEMPVTAWPMVQPIDSTPPMPMSTPPTAWFHEIAAGGEPLNAEFAEQHGIQKRTDDHAGKRHHAEVDQREVGRTEKVAHAVAHRADEREGLHIHAARDLGGKIGVVLPGRAHRSAGDIPADDHNQAHDQTAKNVVEAAAEVRGLEDERQHQCRQNAAHKKVQVAGMAPVSPAMIAPSSWLAMPCAARSIVLGAIQLLKNLS